jgi:hypothetical protein
MTLPANPRNRCAAPGAQRIALTGIMAVPDDFGRVRILLLDKSPGGSYDASWSRLRAAVPKNSDEYSVPYEESEDADIKGRAWFVLPARRRTHFLETAAAARGQWVRVEATIRPFVVTQKGIPRRGTSLDLASIEADAHP